MKRAPQTRTRATILETLGDGWRFSGIKAVNRGGPGARVEMEMWINWKRGGSVLLYTQFIAGKESHCRLYREAR